MEDQVPVQDHASPILAGDPALSDEHRAALWDVFHDSKDPSELLQKLQTLVVPDDTKRRLYDAKKLSMPPAVGPVDKTTAAIQKMTQLDQSTLTLAESHPNVMKAFAAAALTPDKEPGEPAGASKASGKGNTPAGDKKPAPLVQPPRVDGLQHLPPIPDGHHRILASDGGIHDIPADRIEAARAIDPRLHVLNP